MSKHSNWAKNKIAAIFINTEPTLTDQAGARDTDINVIVAQFGIHGQAPGAPGDPIYGDFTGLPQGLRESIETARRLDIYKNQLPDALKGMSIDELLALTPETLRAKLTPAETPADEKKDETK